MASESVAGINIKIGADLSELKQEMGKVGAAIEQGLEPGQEPVKNLSDNMKTTAEKAATTSIKVAAIAAACVKIGNAVRKWTKGMIDEAVKIDPATAQTVENVKNSFNNMKETVVQAFIPLINDVAPKITTIFDNIAKFIQEHPDLSKTIVILVVALGALASVMSVVVPLVGAFAVANTVASSTILIVVGVVIALIAVIVLVIVYFDDIKAAATGAFEWVATEIEILKLKFDNFLEYAKNINFGAILKGLAKSIIDMLANVVSGIFDGLTAGINMAIEGINKALKWAGVHIDPIAIELDTTSIEEQLSDFFGNTDPIQLSAESETKIDENNAKIEELKQQQKEISFTVAETEESTKSIGDTISELTESTGLSGLNDQLTEVTESTKNIGDSVDAIDLSADGGLTGSLDALSSLIEADAAPAIAELGDAVNSANAGLDSLTGQLSSGTAAEQLAGIGGEAEGAATKFYTMADAIYAAIDALLALKRVDTGGGAGKSNHVIELKASGGPVAAGSTYIVGEQGPELFVPHVSGTIIPHEDIGSVSSSSVTVNFNGDVIGDERSIYGLVTRAAKAAIRQEVRAAA